MAINRENSPYRRGIRFQDPPIPMVPDHCVTVDAGAVKMVIEPRQLTNRILEDTYAGGVRSGLTFNDHGASLHVVGAEDGLEYLRFDCFEQEPHYHYIHNTAGGNTVVRIDELAVGDPIEFSLAAVENHLPEMLDFCGVEGLPDEVKGRMTEVQEAMPQVRDLMMRSQDLVG